MAKTTRNKRISGRIKYLRDRIPSFEVPEYKGKTYEDMVPDTLDIQQRIYLAVNGLTGPTDPELDHLIYFDVDLRVNPPVMSHGKDDIDTSKFMESLPLMRLACGSNLNDHIDSLWMEMALRMVGPGGLLYWPSMPYAKIPCYCEPFPRGARHFAAALTSGRMFGAMTAYMLRDPDGPWLETNRGMVDGFCGVAVQERDYAFFPHGAYVPGPKGPRHARVDWKPFGLFSSLFGWLVAGLTQFHRASGYEPAVELAEKLSRFLAFHGEYFGPEGEFLPNNAGCRWQADPKEFQAGPPPVTHRIHFQHHVTPLLGIADHAIAAGSQDLCDFVVKAFEWAKTKGCDLVGYFPENVDNNPELETSETCGLAAMIGLALKLSAAGLGDYWDDADRWIRNQFAENQLLQSDWVCHMSSGGLVRPQTWVRNSVLSTSAETDQNVPERNIGAFAGWPTANDWFVGHGSGIMHCCTGNGTRALYYIWEHMLNYRDGELSINLLLNRPSEWVDLHSHIPYTGLVEVNVKKLLKHLRIRIPQWVQPRQVRCVVNNRQRRLSWDGRYALVGPAKRGDKVTLTFPIAERHEMVHIEKQSYYFTIKGNDVVDVYPRGQFCPLYQRNSYRSSDTRWKKVRRFVSDESVYW